MEASLNIILLVIDCCKSRPVAHAFQSGGRLLLTGGGGGARLKPSRCDLACWASFSLACPEI
jgi:hypothetical protein